jgi:hypothetical protein
MVIVNIMGGLGNQMFQYAFGYAVSKENSTELRIDTVGFNACRLRSYELGLYQIKGDVSFEFEYKDWLNVNGKGFLSGVVRKISIKLLNYSKSFYQEKKDFVFDSEVFCAKENTYFYGYWQNERYFKKYRDDLLKVFTLKTICSQTKSYQQKIVDSESVSLHIRRGDYVSSIDTNSVHGIIDMDFYKRSSALFYGEDTHFFIFSDDLNWAKENTGFINNKTFIEYDRDTSSHEEIYLMSKCKHNIIANSSFSWWGAWLNQNPNKKIIAPRKWFNDLSIDTTGLIPESWVRL